MKKSKIPKLFLEILGIIYLIILASFLKNNDLHNWNQLFTILGLSLCVEFIVYIPILAYRFLTPISDEGAKRRAAYDAVIKLGKEKTSIKKIPEELD
jgi:Kef-type K+ transport system membrane component KefB